MLRRTTGRSEQIVIAESELESVGSANASDQSYMKKDVKGILFHY